MSVPNIAPFNITFRRLAGNPLEDNVYFATLLAAQDYASSPTSIIGQEIKVITTNPADPIQTFEIQRDRTLKLIGSVGGAIEAEIVSTIDVGGVRAGDIVAAGTDNTETWQKLLSPDVHPEIDTFTSTPTAFGLKEVGQVISSVTLTAEVIKGTNNIKSVKIIRMPNTTLTENLSIPNGGDVSITDSVGLDNGVREYRCFVEDTEGLTATSDMKFEFVFPVLVGSVTDAVPSEPTLKALSHVLTGKRNILHAYTHTNQRMCMCVPTTWGLPIVIKDGNGLILSQMLTQTTMTLTFGSHSQSYNVFVFNVSNTVDNYTLNFTFEQE